MLSPITPGCTRRLDPAIAEQRVRYAAERVDFHSFFEFKTVADIGRILRKEGPADEWDDPLELRHEAILDLLWAQQRSPHALWTLLLVQAFEPELVRRRRRLSTDPDRALDHLVVDTFVGALEGLPVWMASEDLRSYVLRTSTKQLRNERKRRASRPAPPVTTPPPSDVLCTGEDDDATEVA